MGTTAFPGTASSLLDNMVSSQKARVVPNHYTSPGLLNGVVSSPETRLVSTHELSQRITPGLFNSLVSSQKSQEGSRRVTPGLLARRTLPKLALSSDSNANANLLSPSPGQKSCSNIELPLNQLTSLDKRRKSMVPSGSRDQASSWEWDLTVSRTSKSTANRKPFKCIICCRPFKHEASMQLHRQRAHSIVRKLKCLKCDQTFETMHNLKVHTMTMHKKVCEEYSCGGSFILKRRFKVDQSSAHSQ